MKCNLIWASVVLLSGTALAKQVPPPAGQPQPPATQPGAVQPGAVQPGVIRQGQSNPSRAQPGERPTNASHSQEQDRQIAALIAQCNRGEVELAKFALDKLQSSEAKEFATMMIKDHTAAAEKFDRLSGTAATQGQTADGARNVQAAGGHSHGANWAVIHQEIARESLAGAKEELNRYKGADFDKAYLGHSVAMHMKTATELKVLAKHVSPQLSTEIESAQKTVQTHLQHVRKLMDEKKDERSDK